MPYNRGMLMVEEAHLPMTISVPGLSDEAFRELCERYADFFVEYTAEGELLVMQPTDPKTSARNLEICFQLKLWCKSSGHGLVTDPSGGFELPDGSRLSPDAAWISEERLSHKPTCPDFVIELVSPTDRPAKIYAKMQDWIRNGASLGWMINPRLRTVTIFRAGLEPEVRIDPNSVAGEGPVAGFVLDVGAVWM